VRELVKDYLAEVPRILHGPGAVDVDLIRMPSKTFDLKCDAALADQISPALTERVLVLDRDGDSRHLSDLEVTHHAITVPLEIRQQTMRLLLG
jgi:hypothetical protein